MEVRGIDLDMPGQLRWLDLPENVEGNTIYRGISRDFHSIANAVLFWAQSVPAHQRYTAWIGRDDGPDIDVETMTFILDVLRAR